MDSLSSFPERSLTRLVSPLDDDLIVAIADQAIFLRYGAEIPTWGSIKDQDLDLGNVYLYLVTDKARWLLCTSAEAMGSVADFQKISLCRAALSLGPEFLGPILTASHLQHWLHQAIHCGHCGGLLEDKEDERARKCDSCHVTFYPRISPCVIVAVQDDDRILLARSPQIPPGRYHLLAGFVEAGETLEDALHREVFEEVGLKIKNLRYFGSQPWPFPDSLMVAFIADYASGELKVDTRELESAQWFPKSQLPELPPRISISRRLIDFVVAHGTQS